MFENVDVSRLTRDYTNEPLRKKELMPESDLRYLFLELNYSRYEIGKYVGCSDTPIRRCLLKYNIKKSQELMTTKFKETCMARYGVASAAAVPEFREKQKKTNLARYGAENPFGSKQIQDKCKETLKRKYGVEKTSQIPGVRERAIKTIQERYGVGSGMQVHINNPKLWFSDTDLTAYILKGNNGKKWRTVELAEYFNITISTVQVRIGELNLWGNIDTHTSGGEQEVIALLKSWGLNVQKYKAGYFEIDIYSPEHKIGIEYNGNYWHSTRAGRDSKYHLGKTQTANSKGIFLYHIFEYEWFNRKAQIINQLKNLFGLNKETIFARKCVVKAVKPSESAKFQDENHIQGSSHAAVHLGLYYKDELVSLMTFGKSRFNKSISWELVRFCSKAGTNVVGGASKLFKHFIRTYNPDSIVSYSDIAKTKGTLYGVLGFSNTGTSKPSYVWVSHQEVYTRYQCQKHLLLKRGFGSYGNTEREIMENRNFAQVFDCGNRVHIWECKR